MCNRGQRLGAVWQSRPNDDHPPPGRLRPLRRQVVEQIAQREAVALSDRLYLTAGFMDMIFSSLSDLLLDLSPQTLQLLDRIA